MSQPTLAVRTSPTVTAVLNRVGARLNTSAVAAHPAFPDGLRDRLPLLDSLTGMQVDAAVEAVGARPGEHIADIGCGAGHGVRRLLGAVGSTGMVYAVDPSRTATTRLRRRHRQEMTARRLKVARAPMHDLPCGRRLLDAVVTTHTLYYIDDLEDAFTEVQRVLAPRGRFILGFSDAAQLSRRRTTDRELILRPVSAVADQLVMAGFDINDYVRVGNRDNTFHLLSANRGDAPTRALVTQRGRT